MEQSGGLPADATPTTRCQRQPETTIKTPVTCLWLPVSLNGSKGSCPPTPPLGTSAINTQGEPFPHPGHNCAHTRDHLTPIPHETYHPTAYKSRLAGIENKVSKTPFPTVATYPAFCGGIL